MARIETHENVSFESVELVWVDESEIIRINSEFLSRDYVTDTISFRYDDSTDNHAIEGTIYCCAPRIKEQAAEFNQPEEKEFLRVCVHSLLHLTGYEDSTPEQKSAMHEREEFYLNP